MAVGGELGITERNPNAILGGLLEQRPRRGIRHLPLEPGVDLRLFGHVPAREERGERKLRIDDEVALLRLGLIEQVEHAPHDRLAAVGLLDGAHLGGANPKHSSSTCPPALHVAIRRSSRLISRTTGHSITR